MMVKWRAQGTAHRICVYSQPEPDVLCVESYRHDGTSWVPYSAEYDFRGTEDGEWNVEGIPDVRRAYRSGGVLHLELVRRYRAGESLWWDTAGEHDYGVQADLMARPEGVNG